MTRSSNRHHAELATDAPREHPDDRGHHRRYRITEGAEEIQLRRVAGYMFGYMKQQAPKGVPETPADRSGA